MAQIGASIKLSMPWGDPGGFEKCFGALESAGGKGVGVWAWTCLGAPPGLGTNKKEQYDNMTAFGYFRVGGAFKRQSQGLLKAF